MAKNNDEIKITFKAFNQEFNKGVKEMNQESAKLRQEMKLQSEQMKHTATESDKLKNTMAGLEQRYEIAQQKTAATADALEKVRAQWGENSVEAQKFEKQLTSNQIAEQQLANQLTQTEQALERAIQAEKERAAATSDSAQKLENLQESEEKLAQSSEKLNAQYELQKAQLGENASESDKLASKMDYLNSAHDVAGQKVANYEKQLDQAKKQYGENSNEAANYERKLLEARTAEQQLANEVKTTNQALQEQNDKLVQTSQKLEEAGRKMTDIGKEMSMKVTAPIVAASTASVLIGANFEASMSQVSAVSGATGKDLQELEDKAREMGATTNKSAKDSADALGFMALAGWDNKEMMEGLEPILKLSSAGNIDLAKTSDLVTDSMSAMRMEVSELPGFLDKVAATASNSNTNIDQLMEAFLVAGGTMAEFNVPLEEASSLLGIMANRGFKGAEAGTAMNAIFTNLTSGLGASGKAMTDMGVSAFDASGNFIGLENTLMLLKGELEGMNEEQRAQNISMIAGKEHLKTFTALMDGLGNEYGELKTDVEESTGALEKMYEIMTDNLKGRWDEFKSALEEAALSIFKSLQPALEVLLGTLKILVDLFNLIPGPIKAVMVVIALLAASIGPLLLVFGFLANSANSLLLLFGRFPAMAAMVTKALTAIRLAIASINLPITLLVAAVAGAVYLIVKYWDEIKEFTITVFTAIKDFLSEWGLQLLVIISGPIGWIAAFIIQNWEEVKVWTTQIFTAIGQFFEDIFKTIGEFITAIVSSIVGFVVSKWQNLSDETKEKIMNVLRIIVSIWTSILNFFTNIVTNIVRVVREKFEGIVTGVREKMGNARNVVAEMLGKIYEYFMQFNIFRAGVNLIKTFIDGIISMFSTVVRVVGEIVSLIPDSIADFLGLDKTVKAGKDVGKGLADGMDSSKGQVEKSAKDLARTGNKAIEEENKKARKQSKAAADKEAKKAEKDAKAQAKKQANEAAKAEKDAIAKAMTAVNSQVSSERAAGTSTPQKEADIWKANIDQFKVGSKERIKAENSYAAARDKAEKERLSAEKKRQAEHDKLVKAQQQARTKAEKDRLAQEVKASKEREAAHKKAEREELAAKKKADAEAKKQTQAQKKEEQQSQVDALTKVNAEIAEKRANGGLTNAEEAEVWKKSIENFKECSKERIKAQNEYANAMKKAEKDLDDVSKDRFDAIKAHADDLKSLDKMSLNQESDYWKQAISQFKKGTKERIAAQKEYQRTLKQINDNVVAVNKKYADQMKAINDKLVDDVKKANSDYDNEFNSRRDSYLNFAGLFDEFKTDIDKTGEDLLDNLNSQVSGFKQWQKEMEKLEYKNVDKSLIDELRSMGPKALPELKALNSLTGSELNKYSNLFKEKSELATKQATDELAGLKESTQENVQAMTDAANKELAGLESAWVAELQKVTSTAEEELKGLQQIGQDAGNNLLEGLASVESALVAQASNLAQKVNQALRDTLGLVDINSALSLASVNVGGLSSTQTAPESNASISSRMLSQAPVVQEGDTIIENHIEFNGTIREEADVQKVARELYIYQQQAQRGRGR